MRRGEERKMDNSRGNETGRKWHGVENIIWESKRKVNLEYVERHMIIFWEKKELLEVNWLFNLSLLKSSLMAKWSDKQQVAPQGTDRPGSPLF